MSHKDYYKILGISRKESTKGIQNAFRNLAKRYHPDKTGGKESPRFRDMVEAYETLSDPKKRRHYDEELEDTRKRERSKTRPVNDSGESFRSRYFEGDISDDRWGRDFSFSSLFNELSKARRSFFDQSEGGEVAYEVILSPREAEEGVVAETDILVPFICPRCGGTGGEWPFYCLRCKGKGQVEREERGRITIPPKVKNRELLEVPFEVMGRDSHHILVQVRIL